MQLYGRKLKKVKLKAEDEPILSWMLEGEKRRFGGLYSVLVKALIVCFQPPQL